MEKLVGLASVVSPKYTFGIESRQQRHGDKIDTAATEQSFTRASIHFEDLRASIVFHGTTLHDREECMLESMRVGENQSRQWTRSHCRHDTGNPSDLDKKWYCRL